MRARPREEKRLLIRGILLSLLAIVAGVPRPAHAGDPGASAAWLEEAAREYRAALESEDHDLRLEGFRRSELLFARVAEEAAPNAELYTNLGNAALQAERLGPAILAYRRALRIDPDHARARTNLRHARGLLAAWVPRPEEGGILDTFFFWHHTLSREQRHLLAALAFSIAATLLAAAVRWRRPWARSLALLPAAIWAGLLLSVLLAGNDAGAAVITADEAVARAADSPTAPSRFPEPLPGGTELQILERRPPWLRIALPDGRTAWLLESTIDLLAPRE